MHIHDKFKEQLELLHQDIKVKYWLVDINNMPNEHIINSLQTMMWDQYEDSPIKDLRYEMFITDQWEKECLQTIINTLESIDDEFFWTARW